jgi:hypothetical protein
MLRFFGKANLNNLQKKREIPIMQQNPPIAVGTAVGPKSLKVFFFGNIAIADDANERIKQKMANRRKLMAVAKHVLPRIISRLKSSWDNGIDGMIANMMDAIAR